MKLQHMLKVQGSTRSILKSLNSQSFLLLGISILVKGMDVPLSPLTPNVILIRKDMCVRGEQFLGWTYFHLEIKAVTLTTLGRL